MAAIRDARPHRLYVAADGPREGREGEPERCAEARRIATKVDWPCEVRTLFRDTNLGCRVGVSTAIDWFFEHEAEGLILEDDCLPSRDFFRFCCELLHRFRDDTRVMSICGSCYADANARYPASYYFSYYADIWGWATWRRAWRHYDRDMLRWPDFRGSGRLEAFVGGRKWRAAYWRDYFDATHEGRIDTWDYQWIYTVMEQSGLACYPTRNLVSNLGFRPDATHTVVADTNAEKHPLADLPRQSLEFPLVHPEQVARSRPLDRQIEIRRLGLKPSSAIGGRLAHKVKSLGQVLFSRFDADRFAG